MVYVIELPDGSPKFQNSDLFARYFHAANLLDTTYAAKILDRLFTESNSDGINFQTTLTSLSADDAEKLLQSWLKDFGANAKEVSEIATAAHSDEVSEIMTEVKNMVDNQVHAKGIPTSIYDGKKHNGLYKAD